MTLVTVDAVVDIPWHVVVREIVRVVAAVASRALEGGVVVRIDMAGRTHSVSIAVINRELRILGVIERRAGPCRRVVTVLAGGREELRLCSMARVRGVVVVGLVTANAAGGQGLVVVIDVAIRALPRWDRVRSCEREGRVVVVERGVCPDRRVVAKFALRRESRGLVGRIVRGSVVLLMAGVAERAVQRVVVVDVALGTDARWHLVRSRQLEAGTVVIEGAIRPLQRVVTGFACRGKCYGDVIHRRHGVGVVLLMAPVARRGRQVVVVVHVAIRTLARRDGVRSGKGEAGGVVVEGRV